MQHWPSGSSILPHSPLTNAVPTCFWFQRPDVLSLFDDLVPSRPQALLECPFRPTLALVSKMPWFQERAVQSSTVQVC